MTSGNKAPVCKVPLREAYPQLVSLEVEIKSVPMGFGQAEIHHHTLEASWGFFTPCPNSQCRDGGFNFEAFVTQLITSGRTSGACGTPCPGSVKVDRSVKRDCHFTFSIMATIEYAEE